MLTTAAALLALVVPYHGCAKRFTVHMDVRAARAVYAATKDVSRRERRMLRRIVRCQRNPMARGFVRGFNAREARRHAARVVAAAHPFSGPVTASWYYDAGTTGCGFHAAYGIATFVVPCGGHVTLRFGSRTVVATRDDSGPYVSGRVFDLDPAVKAALGCSDLCPVYWSY